MMSGTKRITKSMPQHESTTDTVAHHRPMRRQDVLVHELDDEALIYDAATADTHRLNGTALCIWNACDGRRDADQIAVRLTEIYDISRATAQDHVARILALFAERRLLCADPVDGASER